MIHDLCVSRGLPEGSGCCDEWHSEHECRIRRVDDLPNLTQRIELDSGMTAMCVGMADDRVHVSYLIGKGVLKNYQAWITDASNRIIVMTN